MTNSSAHGLFAVLDPARDPAIFDIMMALAPDAWCLFGGPLAEPVRRASPHVMSMPSDGPLLRWWRGDGRGHAWGIACRTDVDLKTLRLHLKTLLRARIPDGRVVLFRFWDPRVLCEFLPKCTPAQYREFFGPIATIFAENGLVHESRTFRREGTE
jgi:hypothetical protein